MISLKSNFLFVHIPKTGGNSIQTVLMPLADDEKVCNGPLQDGIERFGLVNRQTNTTKHSPLTEYKAALPAATYAALYKFCCVRNPWERVISFYFSPHRGAVRFDRNDFIAFARTVPPVVHYLREHEQQGLRDAIANIDRIIRFETMQEGFTEACRELGLPPRPLPHRNSSARQPASRYYDDGTKDVVGEIFGEEIDAFGYRFPAD